MVQITVEEHERSKRERIKENLLDRRHSIKETLQTLTNHDLMLDQRIILDRFAVATIVREYFLEEIRKIDKELGLTSQV